MPAAWFRSPISPGLVDLIQKSDPTTSGHIQNNEELMFGQQFTSNDIPKKTIVANCCDLTSLLGS